MVSLKELKKGIDLFIADELVVEIVSRLPTRDAFRCRHVCRRWRELTSTQQFLDLQRRRQGTVTLILVENFKARQGYMHFFWDKWWEPTRTVSRHQNFPIYAEYKVQFSVDGLIVLKHMLLGRNHIILNPINGENVKISLSKEIGESEIFGVFFHPSLKELCTIWGVTVFSKQLVLPPEDRGEIEVKLLTLGPNPCWRNIKNKCPVHGKKFFECLRPVYVEKCLYWIVYDDQGMKIMEFDVKNEEWTLISAPPVKGGVFIIKRLLNDGGFLSMVEIYPENQQVVACISTLTNRSLQLWTKTRFCFTNDKFPSLPFSIEPISIAHKQLTLFSGDKVFVCNLEMGTINKFVRTFIGYANVFSHDMTLASLKGCKSEFCMDYKGEEKCDVQ